MLHGVGIFIYILPEKSPSFVGKYSSTMVRIWDNDRQQWKLRQKMIVPLWTSERWGSGRCELWESGDDRLQLWCSLGQTGDMLWAWDFNRNSMGFQGDFIGISWDSTGISRNFNRISWGFNGISWDLVGLNENYWNLMGLNGFNRDLQWLSRMD